MRLILLTPLLLLSSLAQSAAFSAGNKSLGIKLSSASIGAENYTIAGASLNYFIIDNLALGGAYEYWFSGKPSVSKIAIDSTYYFPTSQRLRPYLGVLYSHYFIGSHSDIDAYGYRVGVSYLNTPMYVSIGIKQEEYSVDRAIFSNNDASGELIVGFSF